MTQVIIPVKPLSQAKQRLSSVLTPEQRSSLVISMLKDLLHTLSNVAAAQVSVVSSESHVLDIARRLGADGVQEQQVKGYNAAVAFGLSAIEDDQCVAVFPADIPLATTAEIDQLIAQPQNLSNTVRLAPSSDRMGTNGLFMSGKSLLSPAYGHDSFRGYQRAAQGSQIAPEVLELPGIALDVDTPEDLVALTETGCGGATMTFLNSISMAQIIEGRGTA